MSEECRSDGINVCSYQKAIILDDNQNNIRNLMCGVCKKEEKVTLFFDCIKCNTKFVNPGKYIFLNLCGNCNETCNCGEELEFQTGYKGREIIHYCVNQECSNKTPPNTKSIKTSDLRPMKDLKDMKDFIDEL